MMKNIMVIFAVFFLTGMTSLFIYICFQACEEDKKIEEIMNNFSMPSTYPGRSFPDIFYTFCPALPIHIKE